MPSLLERYLKHEMLTQNTKQLNLYRPFIWIYIQGVLIKMECSVTK